MRQDVDVVTDVAWRRRVLLLAVLALRRLLHLDLALHVGLFDDFHLQTHQHSGQRPLRAVRRFGRGRTHQLLRPHVVQYPLSVLAVVATLHDGE